MADVAQQNVGEAHAGETRRDFLILTASAIGGVGVAATIWPFIATLNPARDTLALSTTEVDLAPIQVGQRLTVSWQGKPVFIAHRTPEEIKAAQDTDISQLREPQADADRVQRPEWLVVIGICTHLGCIPLGQKAGDDRGQYGGWFCPSPGAATRIIRWIDYRLPFVQFFNHELNEYPTPRNLSYWWNYGSLAGIMLVVMIVTGIFLAMQYTPSADLAFDSVERIMRDVNFGWLLRYAHMNGASMFFAIVYIHLFRGLYYGSYKAPRELLWILGVIILLLLIATAFMGYVLPWGQMSYWAATVITNLFSAIPLIGPGIVTFLWGGFAVGDPTLHRFYALHYLLPFVILAIVLLHLVALHRHGSNNPLGIDHKGPQDTIPFHPYYTVKDLFGLSVFLLIYSFFVFFAPNFLGSPENSIPANPMQTPNHIVPEWYLLPYYAILRSITFPILFISSKLAGVILAFSSILILFFLPWLDTSPVRSARFRPVYKWVFWLLVIDVVALGWVGANPPEGIVVTVGQIATFYYFVHMLILLPLIGKLERPRPLPSSIGAPVLGGGGARLSGAGAPLAKP